MKNDIAIYFLKDYISSLESKKPKRDEIYATWANKKIAKVVNEIIRLKEDNEEK